MSTEEQLIESLRQTIAVQNDLISHLKSCIDDLKASQIAVLPYTAPNPPLGPIAPLIDPSPLITPGSPYTPIPPNTPWYGNVIVTSTEIITNPTEGVNLPAESTSGIQ